VSHGHILVNGRRVDIRSYILKAGDVISLTNAAKEMVAIKNSIEVSARKIHSYIEQTDKFEGKLLRAPEIHEIPYEVTLNPQAVIELYSK